MPPTEGCRSGRTGRSRKPLGVQAPRGFKSLPLRIALRRPRPRGVPDEVDEEPAQRNYEDPDDPQHLAKDAEVVAADDADRDEQPHEEERDQRRSGQALPERVPEEHAPSLVR